MKLISRLFTSLFLSLLLIGCGKEGQKSISSDNGGTNKVSAVEAKRKAPRPQPVVDTLAPTAVVVRVNGHDITQKDFKALERVRGKIWALCNNHPIDVFDRETRKEMGKKRMPILGSMIKDELIRQYAEKKGIRASDDRLKVQERKYLKIMKKGKSTLDDIAKLLGDEDGQSLKRMVYQDALIDTVLQGTTTNSLFTITEQEITNYVKFVQSHNEMADKKNADSMARARAAKAEILAKVASNATIKVDSAKILKDIKSVAQKEAGTNKVSKALLRDTYLENSNTVFAVTARKYADTNSWEGVSWQSLELSELDAESPLLQWLVQAQVGDITDPMELDDGIAIIGLKLKNELEPLEEGQPPLYEYELVRCYFYYYEKLPEYSERADIIEAIREARWNLAMGEVREKLTKDAVIEFPCGRNLFYPKKQKIKKKSKDAGKAGDSKKAVRRKPKKKAEDVKPPVEKNVTQEKNA